MALTLYVARLSVTLTGIADRPHNPLLIYLYTLAIALDSPLPDKRSLTQF